MNKFERRGRQPAGLRKLPAAIAAELPAIPPQVDAVGDAPSIPARAPLTQREVRTILMSLLLTMFLAALDQTIVATALPTIVADLGGAGHQSWVVTSYLLASTIITALVGKFGDLFGRKAVFQAAVVFFVAGSRCLT
jgi:hypothetical protein